MKRLHVHVAVKDLSQSVRFYSTLFAAEPSVIKLDYAKWMLDDPRVNFAISSRGATAGLDHLGIQVENQAELHEVYGRLKQADRIVLEEGATACCYAKSEKSWIADPAGIAWETFHTSVELASLKASSSACCAPNIAAAAQATERCGDATPAKAAACCG
jgi:catechol 2,3-dioxygenase-like lactoylglutathione lyase family enzyme